MRRLGPILVACAVLVGAVVLFVWSGGRSVATGASSAELDDDESMLGGYGSLGGGGSASVTATGRPSAEMPGLDAGLPLDAGEGAPVPLALPAPSARVDPPALAATSTFPSAPPRTVEDEYDSANLVWGMIEVRRESVRAELAEARRTGDQQLSARLAHQLELLEIGDRRMSGIVRELEGQRVPTEPAGEDPDEDAARDEGAEGAPPL